MNTILNHLIQDHGATMEQAKIALQPWSIEPLLFNEQQVGEIMIQNNEVHIALEPTFRRRLGRGKWIKQQIERLLTSHEFLVTRLFKHDDIAKLIEFIGFRQVRSDAEYNYYWLDRETINASA